MKFKSDLTQKILTAIDDGYRIFYSGMAMGVDIIAFEILIELKSTHSDIFLHSVMPIKNQCYYWSDDWIKRHAFIRQNCDSLKIVNTSNIRQGCLARNRYMVDNSDLVIAVFNGDYSSGTGYTISYANRNGKEVQQIDIPRY